MGYHRAGFDEIVGVDNRPQKRYPFQFVQADALEFCASFGAGFDAIHASPPCQAYTAIRTSNPNRLNYWEESVPMTRRALITTGRPYVLENVPGAPTSNAVQVCGLSVGVNVRRHRLFESNVFLWSTPCIAGHPGNWVTVVGRGFGRKSKIQRHPKKPRRDCVSVADARIAMGIDWMTGAELSQAIPPAYCEFIGKQLIVAIEHDGARRRAYSSHSRTLDISSSPDPETSYDLNMDVLVGNASSGCLPPSTSAVIGAS